MSVQKWIWTIFGSKVFQSDLIVMKLRLIVSCHLPDVYPRFQVHITKYAEIKLGKHSTGGEPYRAPPAEFLRAPEGKIFPDYDENQHGWRHLLYECVYEIWKVYVMFEDLNEEKWLTYFWL